MDYASIERRLLGTILISPGVLSQAAGLREQNFGLEAHKLIWRALRTLSERGEPVDELALEGELERRGQLAKGGGLAYIVELTSGAVERKDIRTLVRAVLDCATRRNAANVGDRLQRLADDASVSTTALTEVAADFAVESADPSDEGRPEQFSEGALLHRFVREYGNDFRYVTDRGYWLRWEGTHWRKETTVRAFDAARKICCRASGECCSRVIASARTVAGVIRLAQEHSPLLLESAMLDADPWALNTPYGVVDLRTGETRKHQREDYLTKMTAVGPSDEEFPVWLSFLCQATSERFELEAFLQRMAGYGLTGSTRDHAIFFLCGTGANGKSVFVNTLCGVLGDYARTASTVTFTATRNEQHPTDVASLIGARVVAATETEDGSRWAESKIKNLTGGDRISARFMRQDPFEFVPQFKLIVSGNHKPGLRSVDEAMRRRLHLIPFTRTIPPEERDPQLSEKLRAEWGGILRWMIAGCLAWQQQGLNPPEVVRGATDEYLAAEDAMGRWMEERCELARGSWTPVRALFANWQKWCEKTGEHSGSLKAFSQALQARGFEPERTGGDRTRGFTGIAVLVGTDGSDTCPI
jgi:putative DNA primase/helicase